MNIGDSQSRVCWIYSVVACALFGILFLFVSAHASVALCGWGIAVGVYVGLLALFGSQFAIEGSIVVALLSVLIAVMMATGSQARGG